MGQNRYGKLWQHAGTGDDVAIWVCSLPCLLGSCGALAMVEEVTAEGYLDGETAESDPRPGLLNAAQNVCLTFCSKAKALVG